MGRKNLYGYFKRQSQKDLDMNEKRETLRVKLILF